VTCVDSPLFIHITIRYDTRCYFNVRSKAWQAQISFYSTEPKTKKWKKTIIESKNKYAQKHTGRPNSPVKPWSQPWRKKRKATEGLSLEWKSEGAIDDECGESMETFGRSATLRTGWINILQISEWWTERSRELIPAEGRHVRKNHLLFVEKMIVTSK